MEDLIPPLAAALDQLRRSPGKNAAWAEGVLGALKRDRPASYDRLRRRLGFAGRLADLARLGEEERATMSLGLFFHELIGDAPREDAAKPARAWTEYLLRNEDWLIPCFRVSEALHSPNWDDIDARAAVVAKVAAIFDLETLERHSRPLQVMQSLPTDGPTPAVEQIVPLLWSEDGQALCDHHFRQRAKGYTLDAGNIRDSLELLKPASPRPAAETPVAPLRLSGSAIGKAKTKNVRKPDPRADVEVTPSGNFERRRRALRSSSARNGLLGGDSARTSPQEAEEPSDERTEGTRGESAAQESAHGDSGAEFRLPATRSTRETEQTSPTAPEPREEEDMEIQSISSARAERPDSVDVAEKLRALRSQFDQIQRVAAEGQKLLDSLAPQLEELASWIVDLETLVDRWKGHAGSGEKAV